MLHTTFRLLKNHRACKPGYKTLAVGLGGIRAYGRDTPIPLTTVLDKNGLDDAVWCLRAVLPEEEKSRDKLARLFVCRCVRETPLGDGRTVWDLLSDERSRKAIEVAERFANGNATSEERVAAHAAALAAYDRAYALAAHALAAYALAYAYALAAHSAARDDAAYARITTVYVRNAARVCFAAGSARAARVAQTSMLRELLGVSRLDTDQEMKEMKNA